MDKKGVLREYFGHESFRQGQEALIDALLRGGDALGIMPTGAGKSACYQVPALMSEGVALVISPLISLMCDQVAALKAAGAPAAYINSTLSAAQQAKALSRAAQGQYKIVYVAPERLDVPEFCAFARDVRLSLVAVDDAHCVSQWGQDFRPSYLRIADFIEGLPQRPPVGAFTATATPVVKADIIRLLRLRDPLVAVTSFDRANLRFISEKPKDKFAALLQVVERHAGESGIVYCATRKVVEKVCDDLRRSGYAATRYHAGLSDQERQANQDDFQYDRSTVMVATNAFGMGIDKSNVAYVVHYNMPKNLESYYQEAGRAGRDGSAAECVLLYSGQDVITGRWMIEHGEEAAGLDEAQRLALRQRDQERLRQMTFYATSRRCLRKFILNYFGEDAPGQCGNCSVCLGLPFATEQAARKAPREAKRRKPARAEEPLMIELKALRGQLAAQRGVPAYVVFPDASLRDMVSKRPHTREEFLAVSGVGAAKQRQYGQAFLQAVADYEARTGDRGAAPQAANSAPGMERSDLAWSEQEDEQLRLEALGGGTLKQLSAIHHRAPEAIAARLKLLGF